MDPMSPRTAPKRAAIMAKLGYGPDHPLEIKVSARNIPIARDPAVILIDQLKRSTSTANSTSSTPRSGFPSWRARTTPSHSASARAASTIPTSNSIENYACGSVRNCHRLLQSRNRQTVRPAVDGSRSAKSAKQLVWQIDARLQQDGARPVIYLQPRCHLLAALRQRADDHGQQHLQWLAHGRRLARSLTDMGD